MWLENHTVLPLCTHLAAPSAHVEISSLAVNIVPVWSPSRFLESSLRNTCRQFFQLSHFVLFLLVDWRQIILNYLVLPVIDGSVPDLPIFSIRLISHVHPCIVLILSYTELIEFFSKKFWLTLDGLPDLILLLLLFYPWLLPVDEVPHRCLFLKSQLWAVDIRRWCPQHVTSLRNDITIIHIRAQHILRAAPQRVIASLAQACQHNPAMILPRSLLKRLSGGGLRGIRGVYLLIVSSSSSCRQVLGRHLHAFVAFELCLARIHAPLGIDRFGGVADNLLRSHVVVPWLLCEMAGEHAWHWMLRLWTLFPLRELNVATTILMNIWWRGKVGPRAKSYSTGRVEDLLLPLLAWLGSLRRLVTIHSSKLAICLLRHVHHLKLGGLRKHETFLLRFGRSQFW